MKKATAVELLGGTPADVARAVGISRQAFHRAPDPLPRSLADRVLATRLRLEWQVAIAQGIANTTETPPVVLDAITI